MGQAKFRNKQLLIFRSLKKTQLQHQQQVMKGDLCLANKLLIKIINILENRLGQNRIDH